MPLLDGLEATKIICAEIKNKALTRCTIIGSTARGVDG